MPSPSDKSEHPDKQRPATPTQEKPKSLFRRLHSPAVMMVLILILLGYLAFYLAQEYGIEGEAGWLAEIGGAVIAILGVIAIAVVLGIVLLWFASRFRRRKAAPWLEELEEQVKNDK